MTHIPFTVYYIGYTATQGLVLVKTSMIYTAVYGGAIGHVVTGFVSLSKLFWFGLGAISSGFLPTAF